MQVKTVTYQRVLNLGEYNSKRLELYADVKEGEDSEAATRKLMLEVEEKIREDIEKSIVQKIENLRALERELRAEVTGLRTEIEQLRAEKAQLSPNPNSIKFETSADEITETDF